MLSIADEVGQRSRPYPSHYNAMKMQMPYQERIEPVIGQSKTPQQILEQKKSRMSTEPSNVAVVQLLLIIVKRLGSVKLLIRSLELFELGESHWSTVLEVS